MSLHISAKAGEIEKIILMPGDPLRAKYISENMLDNAKLVSSTRNTCFYTGTYNETPVTIGSSGMGCPSIGIYSYELYSEYEAACIIRVGTAGAYQADIKLFDIINASMASSESTYAEYAFGIMEKCISHQGKAYDIINETAAKLDMPVLAGALHSSDVFYRSAPGIPSVAAEHNCLAVEMEAFALFANAQHLNKMAATLVTVSDLLLTGEHISPDERERSLQPMMKLALESVVNIHQSLV